MSARSTIAEPTPEEYAAIKKECRSLFIKDGLKASAFFGTMSSIFLYLFSKYTRIGSRMSMHPYAILVTAAYVAPFWIVGEQSALLCQRGAYDKRKLIIQKDFEREKFNDKHQ